MSLLDSLGFTAEVRASFQSLRADGCEPARVIAQHRDAWRVLVHDGELTADLAGRLAHRSAGADDLPAVGDWVAVHARRVESRATIRHVLPRRTALVRKQPDRLMAAQVLVANVDHVLLVSALDRGVGARRIERFLAVIWESGAQPVVVLTKSDLCADVDAALAEASAAAVGAPVHAVSAVTGAGVEELRPYLASGATAALLGPSGAGKSTLVNRLVGDEVLAVGSVRDEDQRGRHTTTHRQLVVVPGGGCLVDTPGLREMALWDAGAGVEETFSDVEELAQACRFRDCRHDAEPGCAVQAAVESGALDAGRLDNFRRLRRELAYLERRDDVRAMIEEHRRNKSLSRAIREHERLRRSDGRLA